MVCAEDFCFQQRKRVSFEEILSTPEYLDQFRQYTMKNYCNENLDFYEAALLFKKTWPKNQYDKNRDDSAEYCKHAATEIYEKWIKRESPEEINVNSDVRDEIERQIGIY
jgi:hypothetical protein